MVGLLLLISVTVLYAGYNLFIKVSGSHVPEVATTTIAATICLQLAALATSFVFASVLLVRGGHVMQLSLGTYGWAAVAGLCIGTAEIAYFYLFGGIGTVKPMAANVAIPAIVCGTTVITMAAGYFFFKETLSPVQMIGGACVVLGIVLIYLGRG
ncbi:MAG: EamA family transporter [Kiloniellales bacterium]